MSIIDDEEEMKDYGLIEIDGVNVAECSLFQIFYDSTKEVELKWCNAHNCACADFDNCQYKQLQRLKFELKVTKADYEASEAEIEKLKKEKTQLLKDCNSCNFHKYKQALEEIKRLANKYEEKQVRYEILRIINEVLNG